MQATVINEQARVDKERVDCTIATISYLSLRERVSRIMALWRCIHYETYEEIRGF